MSNYYNSIQAMQKSAVCLINILKKAKDWSKEQGLNETEVLKYALAEDMFPLSRQVQLVSDNLKGVASRLTNREVPKMEDTEATFDELIERLQKTIDYVNSIDSQEYDQSDVKIKLFWMPEGKYLEPQGYFYDFVIPNYYFHLVTAYDILRNKGLNIGKMDIIAQLDMKQE